MFGFLTSLLGASLSTHIIEFLCQLILFYSIYKLGETKSNLWRIICQRLSLFLIFETFVQFAVSLNTIYFFILIPLFVKIAVGLIVVLPLIKLWLELPKLIFKYKNNIDIALDVIKNNDNTLSVVDFQVTKRLLNSLKMIDHAQAT